MGVFVVQVYKTETARIVSTEKHFEHSRGPWEGYYSHKALVSSIEHYAMSTVVDDVPVYIVFRQVLVSSIIHLELFPPVH